MNAPFSILADYVAVAHSVYASGMPLVAGVDCSTQATKVLVVDTADGTVVATGRAEHEVTGAGGTRETHPLVWRAALARALAETGRVSAIAAISVAGQQHGLVVTDGSGSPLRPAMLWNDTRAAPDAESMVADAGGPDWWAAEIGSVPVASFTAPKWAWLRRNEPDVADAARAVRLPHDHLTELLTGSGVTDRGDASGTAWWSTRSEEYSPDVLDRIRLDPDLLPRVLGPTEPAGTVTSDAAAEFGMAEGVVVGPGTGDNMGAALGLGLEAGIPVISLGTSGTAYAVSTRRTADPSGTVAGFADAAGAFLPLAATLNCTLAVDRVATLLNIDREAAADRTDVVVLPYFDGERTPNLPNATATITGLRHDTEPGEILLAAYQGAAFSLLGALDALAGLGSGLEPDAPIVLIGGGAKGETWRRVVGELSGRPLVVPDGEELVAMGAAVQAAAVLEGSQPEAVAARWDTQAGQRIEAVARDDDRLSAIGVAIDELFGGR
jgi:xylulokinase